MSSSQKKVAVIGLGYVGLPLATLCARQGYRVAGLDSNQRIVDRLLQGECPIRDAAVKQFAGAGAGKWSLQCQQQG